MLAGKTVGDVRAMLQANLDRGDKVLASSTSYGATRSDLKLKLNCVVI
jgi:hypothetical protein